MESQAERKEEPSSTKEDRRASFELPITCQICSDYIVYATNTRCDHTFCEECLNEYLLCIDECPTCYKRLRDYKLASNVVLDNIISEFIKKNRAEHFEDFNSRKNAQRILKNSRNVGELAVGAEVDIRDSDYVWRKGKVIRGINRLADKKIKYVIVKYDKCAKKQELPESSSRLAKLNSYTTRKDIPYYLKGKLFINDEEGNQCPFPKHLESDEE